MNRKINIIGVMSGTSLDGLDIALCEFNLEDEQVQSFEIHEAITISYTESQKESLKLMQASALDLVKADFAFGKLIGESVKAFVDSRGLYVDFIASHGHTVFHQPHLGFTSQIGNGAAISAACGLPVVSDFRSMDVAMSGEGAPLVPIGDLLLFDQYKYCLNLGGIANISVKESGHIYAFDVCPANMPLNMLVNEIDLQYDKDGKLAKSGSINQDLLEKLNALDFYAKTPPKSLGKEWVDTVFMPIITSSNCSLEDMLATICEHIALKISELVSESNEISKMLVTGGGAFNSFLIERIQGKLNQSCEVVVPDTQLIGFKEALIFAFLGLLRIQNKPNALQSVTGAANDNIGGALYGDFSSLCH
jgi:anhydro-N-acetylmuramic acid kinase